MSERMLVVCDVCGGPAETTVALRVENRSMQKDLCATHLAELLKGTRRPRRGRRPKTATISSLSTSAARTRRRAGRTKKAAS
jgi:hypothetical protein